MASPLDWFLFSHLVVEFVALLLIIWYGVHHGWSKGMFIIVQFC